MQKKHLSYKQYRNLDLTIFAVMMVIFEVIIFKAATKWFADQLYTVSLIPAIVAIVIMRWDYFGLLHAALGGFVYSFIAGGTVLQFMCYTAGNLFCFFAIIFKKTVGKEKIKGNSALSILFAVLVSLFMQLGRAAVSFAMGFGLAESAEFITTDALSGLFAILVIIVTRKPGGIFEDQKSYLERIQKEEQERVED